MTPGSAYLIGVLIGFVAGGWVAFLWMKAANEKQIERLRWRGDYWQSRYNEAASVLKRQRRN